MSTKDKDGTGRTGSMLNRWKKNRTQSGQSGVSTTSAATGTTRPTTAVNSWTEYAQNQDEPFQKAVEEAVLSALNSDAFRNVIASQIDPVTAALSRQQEKLNGLKASTLNLESSLETALGTGSIKSYLEPALTSHLKSITQMIGDLPHNGDEIKSILDGQNKVQESIKSLEERLTGVEEKLASVDGEIVNADLRSAIRFGELSNELQDRNKMLGERLWSVEGDLGKKMEAQHRRLVGMFEELGKSNRNVIHKVSSLDMDSNSSQSSKLDEMLNENSQMVDRIEGLRKGLTKLEESQKNIQTSEKGLARNIQEVRDIVSSLNTSSLDAQGRRLDEIERGISNVRKELEAHGTLASLDSKLLSTNTARLSNIITQVTKIEEIVESVSEHVSTPDETIRSNSEKLDALSTTAATIRDTLNGVDSHVKTLNTSQFDIHRDKLNFITSMMTSISETMTNQGASLDSIHRKIEGPLDTTGLETVTSMLHELKSISQSGVESHSSLLSTHTTKLDTISHDLSNFHSNEEATLKTITISLERLDNGAATERDSIQGLHSQFEKLGTTLENQDVVLRDIKQSDANAQILGALDNLKSFNENGNISQIVGTLDNLKSSIENDTRSDQIIRELLGMKEFVDSVKADNRKSEIIQDLAAVRSIVDAIKNDCKDNEIMTAIKDLDTSVNSTNSETKYTEIMQSLDAIMKVAGSHSTSLGAVHTDILEIKEDTIGKTLSEILAIRETLKQTTSSLASAYDGILSVDTKIKSSEESVCNAIKNLHSAIESDIVDNKSTLVTSINDVATELEKEMKNLTTRLSTSTNVLRSEIKNIDFGPTNNSLDAITRDVQSTYKTSLETAGTVAALPEAFTNIKSHVSSENVSMNMSLDSVSRFVASIDEAIKETGRDLQGNTEMLTNIKSSISTSTDDIRFLLDKQVPLIRQDIKSIDFTQLELAATKNQSSIESIEKSVPEIIRIANDHAEALGNLDYKMKYLIAGDIAKIGKAIEAVDQALAKAALETISAVEGNAIKLSNIRETVLATFNTVDTLTHTNIPGISFNLETIEKFQRKSDHQTMEKLQANLSSVGSIRNAIEHLSTKMNDNSTILSDIISSSKENSTSIQSLSTNINNLDSTINQTTTAVRVNAAALSRIDKDVLETGAQIKSVVIEGNQRLSKELDSTLSQLDETTHDNGTRLRGISEFAFPKIENEMKGVQTSLERLMHSNVDGLGRTRDALEVIGARIVGTSRKFDDLVDAVRAGDEFDGGGSSHHSKSLIGGNGKVPGEHRILGTRKSMGGSNASGTKESHALSGLRAFNYG